MTTDLGVLSTAVTVNLPDSVIDGAVPIATKVVVVEEVGRHDLINVEFTGVPSTFGSSLLSGSPMYIETVSRAGHRGIYGYVVSPSPTTERLEKTTTVVGLGITYPMKATSGKVWGPQSVSQTMAEIIYGHGLTPYVEDTGIYQGVPQAGRSDWEVLRDVAEQSGLLVFTTGSTVNCLSPPAIFGSFQEEAAHLRYRTPTSTRVYIDDLDSVSVTTDQVQRSRVNASAIDPVTAKVFNQRKGSGLFTNQGSTITARSPYTLRQKVGAAQRMADFPTTMEIKGPGNVLVGAGKPVYVDNDGVPNWWIVHRVTHTFDPINKVHDMSATLKKPGFPVDLPAPPRSGHRGFSRQLPNYCFCREHEPVLVGAARANYVTNQDATPDTDPMYLWTDVQEWMDDSPVKFDSPAQVYPFGGWVSLRRWRARGKCP